MLLASAEYACNDHMNTTTGKVPFRVVLRFVPEWRMQPALQTQM